jgi:hypothetical protein
MIRELPLPSRIRLVIRYLYLIFQIVIDQVADGTLVAKKRGMDRIRESGFWRSSTFWLTVAAIVLPFGWLLFALKLEPVRIRARYFRRTF